MGPVFAPLAHRGALCFPSRRLLYDADCLPGTQTPTPCD